MTVPAPSPFVVRRGGSPVAGLHRAVPLAAAGGAATLAVSSTGSIVVAAVLLGVASWSVWSGVAAVLATAAVAIRFATTDFGDLAGLQSVLGAAGVVGPASAAASSWTAAAAVVLTARTPERFLGPVAGLVNAVATGAVAATIVAGPGPGGGLAVRIAATVAAVVASAASAATSRWSAVDRARPLVATVVAASAVVLAAWPS